jgi:hypothetical protein
MPGMNSVTKVGRKKFPAEASIVIFRVEATKNIGGVHASLKKELHSILIGNSLVGTRERMLNIKVVPESIIVGEDILSRLLSRVSGPKNVTGSKSRMSRGNQETKCLIAVNLAGHNAVLGGRKDGRRQFVLGLEVGHEQSRPGGIPCR